MTSHGHEILIISRNKEIEHKLLKAYQIPFIDRGKGKNGRILKFVYLVYADLKILYYSIKFQPDLYLSFLHPYAAHVGFLLKRPVLIFSDTEHAKLHHKLTVPFASEIFTPNCYTLTLGQKHKKFKGFMELSYLHPNYFTPDPRVLEELNLSENDKYVIVRFVGWNATHDFGHPGISLKNKILSINLLAKISKVFISSEEKLPTELKKYQINISPEKMHHAIYYSSLLFGESATMASEAAMVGTPSIFIDNASRGYTKEIEAKYGLIFNFSESQEDQISAINKAIEILSLPNSREFFKSKRKLILDDCIDTTSFMVSEVLKYEPNVLIPSSFNT
jgi:predicted glycosyltransferase